jgi:hypothetical protein
MRRKSQARKPAAKITRTRKLRTRGRAPSSQLEKVLALIRKRPGIRPSEINRLLHVAQSDAARAALLRGGLIRKEKDGAATRYHPL